jgi:hypothetical protein
MAEPVRVTTWSFSTQAGSEAIAGQVGTAAAALSRLDPEIILLQGVKDWGMCRQLAEALNPDAYNVIGCSAFTGPAGPAPYVPQVAIISKYKAYFFWTEAWSAPAQSAMPGGFAFAAVQAGNRRLGLFSVQLDPRLLADPKSSSVSNSVQRWTHTFAILRNWDTNRVEAAIVAGAQPLSTPQKGQTLNPSANFLAFPITRPIFQPGLGPVPERPTNFFAAHFIPGLEGLPGVVLAPSGVTCDLDFDGVMPPTVATENPMPVQTATLSRETARNSWWLPATLGAAIAGSFVWILLRSRSRNSRPGPALIAEFAQGTPDSGSAFTVTVTPQSTTGSALGDASPGPKSRSVVNIDAPKTTRTQSEVLPGRMLRTSRELHPDVSASLVSALSQWLKQKLVRRLIADRAKLVATHQESTFKVMRVNERLARIEAQLKEQNQAYENRIARLTEQLGAAKEENRELIRAQIVRVKAEMEAARAKLVAESKTPE